MAIKLSEKLGDPKWIRMSERIAQLMKEKEEPERERRFLFCDGLLLVRHSNRFVYSDFRDRALLRLVRSSPRTAGRQSALSAPAPNTWANRSAKKSCRLTSDRRRIRLARH